MMPPLATPAAREEIRRTLERLLADEIAALAELERLLDTEREVLVRNDSPEALEDACARRQDCMGGLLRIQDERRGLLRMLGFEADTAGLDRLMRICDPERSLPARWSECAERARRCREINDFNGALVSSRMRRVAGLLEILTGRKTDTPVYGRQGQQAWAGAAGRLLATEA
ncbi:MAG: flagella synthesis protein FlgN [Gammaproteobacteria bacterium]